MQTGFGGDFECLEKGSETIYANEMLMRYSDSFWRRFGVNQQHLCTLHANEGDGFLGDFGEVEMGFEAITEYLCKLDANERFDEDLWMEGLGGAFERIWGDFEDIWGNFRENFQKIFQ